MKKSKPDTLRKNMAPFRREIDQLDRQIARLLGKRFDVIRRVARLKIENGYQAYIQERVDEVRENAVADARRHGIDPEFMRTFYTLMIYESCATEDLIKCAHRKKTAKKKQAAPRKTVRKKAIK